MAIYLIDTLKQKNNQSFPIADVNDLKGGFYQVDTIEERNIIPQSRIREGMLCFVKQSPNHWYQYLEGNWTLFQITLQTIGGSYIEVDEYQEIQNINTPGVLVYVKNEQSLYFCDNTGKWRVVGRSGSIPLYTQSIINSIGKENLPEQYIVIPDVEDLSGEIKEQQIIVQNPGGYLDIIFSALRSLQSEVAKLKNSFNYGINSVDGTQTALNMRSFEIPDESKEPLWAVQESQLSEIPDGEITLGIGSGLEPETNIDVSVDGQLTIKGSAHYDFNNIFEDIEDPKTFTYIISNKKTIVIEFSNGTSSFNLDISKLNIPQTSLYNILLITSKTQTNKDSSIKGKNYIYLIIKDQYNDRTIASGYWKNNTLYSDVKELDNSYYITGVSFIDLTLTKYKSYSRYQDFTEEVIPQAPDDSTYKYKAAHLTIRGCTKAQADQISNQLLPHEFFYDDDTDTLYIKNKKGQLKVIGAASSGGNTDTMTKEEVIEILKEMGIVNDNSLKLNPVSDITFINEDTGKTYNITIDPNGNLVSKLVVDGTISDEVASLNMTISKTPDDIRGFIARLNGARYTKDTQLNLTPSDNYGVNSDRLKIGSIYAPFKEDTIYGCSHAFIELENTDPNNSYNLNGFYLYFTHMIGTEVELLKLPLTGVIEAGGTYLIRGKQYNSFNDSNCFIKVQDYDQEWYVNGNLIDFSFNNNEGVSFLLVYGDQDINYNTMMYDTNSNSNTSTKAPLIYPGYFIDSFVLGKMSANVGTTQSGSSTYYWAKKIYKNLSNTIVKNMFELDPANQAYQALNTYDSSRSRWDKATDIQYLNLNKEYIEFPKSDDRREVSYYTPKASKDHKNVSTDKTKLDLNKPNMVTCAFGINMLTTRTFNWISAGQFDEYVWIKVESAWKRFESYKKISTDISQSNTYPRRREFTNNLNNIIYARINGVFPADGTNFTSHKCIIDIVSQPVATPTTYKYVVGRADKNGNPDIEHTSEEMTFTLYPESYTPRIYQITDQQGFHWIEYQAWAAAAKVVNNKINNDLTNNNIIPVLINTGDMTQNGTRINEWLDYYKAGYPLFKHLEQMNVVGNNDLCDTDINILGTGDDKGKSNGYFFSLFYCYEIDPNIAPIFTGVDGITRYIPSVYYFGNNRYSFLMVNSEITAVNCRDWFKAATNTSIIGSDTINGIINIYTGYTLNSEKSAVEYVETTTNTYIYEQLYKILTKLSNTEITAVCHEMPFTVITHKCLDPSAKVKAYTRSMNEKNSSQIGSKLNQMTQSDYKGTYWFSRLLESFRVKLCIGGHKHTYACTFPIKENIAGTTTTTMPLSLKDDTYELALDSTGTSYTKRPFVKCPNGWIPADTTNSIYPGVQDTTSGGVVYFMCQATGFKLKSNKELPSNRQVFSCIIPKTKEGESKDSPSNDQLRPMFAIINPGNSVELIRINNIMDNNFNFLQNSFGTEDSTLEYASLTLTNTDDTKYYGTWGSDEQTLITL